MKKIICTTMFLAAVGATSFGCSAAPSGDAGPSESQSSELDFCRVLHLPGTTDPTNVSDREDLPLSALPSALANAGCTSIGTYQLGIGSKPARYAVCPTAYGWCSIPSRHVVYPCSNNAAVDRFVAQWHLGDDDLPPSSVPYGYAHVRTTNMCDWTFSSRSLPAGYEYVVWHEGGVCFADSAMHDAAISQETGAPIPGGGGGGGLCSPNTNCSGGCMKLYGPPGI